MAVLLTEFYDIKPPECSHAAGSTQPILERDCVSCVVSILKMYLPVYMQLSVEHHEGKYVACVTDRDGFFRIVAEGLTPAIALFNLRNPLALIAFMSKVGGGFPSES
jgi:hypothetical protein